MEGDELKRKKKERKKKKKMRDLWGRGTNWRRKKERKKKKWEICERGGQIGEGKKKERKEGKRKKKKMRDLWGRGTNWGRKKEKKKGRKNKEKKNERSVREGDKLEKEKRKKERKKNERSVREFDELEKKKKKGRGYVGGGEKKYDTWVVEKKKSYETARVRNRMEKIRYFGSCEKK